MSSSETVGLDTGDWLRGLLQGSLAAFAGFFAGLLIQAIFGVQATPPSYAAALPYIGTLGGFTFGFVTGAGRDLIA